MLNIILVFLGNNNMLPAAAGRVFILTPFANAAANAKLGSGDSELMRKQRVVSELVIAVMAAYFSAIK